MSKLLILITTESSEKLAKNLAKLLVKKKLAACVSIKPIYSIYEWEGDIEESKEFEITIKSKAKLKNDLINFLHKKTSYDIPQIILKKFHTESKYNNWLNKTI